MIHPDDYPSYLSSSDKNEDKEVLNDIDEERLELEEDDFAEDDVYGYEEQEEQEELVEEQEEEVQEEEQEEKKKEVQEKKRGKKKKQKKNDKAPGLIFGVSKKVFVIAACCAFFGVVAMYGYDMFFTTSSTPPQAAKQSTQEDFDLAAVKEKAAENKKNDDFAKERAEEIKRAKAINDTEPASSDISKAEIKKVDKDSEQFPELDKEIEQVQANNQKLQEEMSDIKNTLVSLEEYIKENLHGQTASNENMISKEDHEEVVADKKVLSNEIAKLTKENENLSNDNTSLKAKVKEYKGKNDWLRALEAKHRKKVEGLEEKLNSFKQTAIFSGWKVLGMSDDVCVLGRKDDPSQTQILRSGDKFQGVKITQIDVEANSLITDVGIIKANQINKG